MSTLFVRITPLIAAILAFACQDDEAPADPSAQDSAITVDAARRDDGGGPLLDGGPTADAARDASAPPIDEGPPLDGQIEGDGEAPDALPIDAAPDPEQPYAHCRSEGVVFQPHEGARWRGGAEAGPAIEILGEHTLKILYEAGVSRAEGYYRLEAEAGAEIAGLWAAMDAATGRAELCGPRFSAILSEGGLLDVTDDSGVTLIKDLSSQCAPACEITRETPADEAFFGFGEKTGDLNKRGARMAFYNTDAYDTDWGGFAPDQEPLYLSIPFFIGLREGRAYGVFVENTHRLEVDMAASNPSRYTLRADGGRLDQYLFIGPKIEDVTRRYLARTGPVHMPPRWALGYHQCRWGYANREEIEHVTQTLRDLDMPADAIWLDIQHLDGFRTFTVDDDNFPDFEGMIEGLHANGFKVVTIQDPGIKVDPGWPVYERMMAEALYIRGLDGGAWTGQAWPGESMFPDFSLPAAYDFWMDEIRGVIERGVDGIWLDVNEPTVFPESGGGVTLPDALPVDGGGAPTTMAELHNVYAQLEAQATYDGIKAARPDERPFILTRAGWAGIQTEAAVWTGDAPSSWVHLQGALPMLLNMGLSGVPFVGSDVGGYSGHATPELFARWMSLGALSPFFRGHVTSGVPGQEPWAFGIEVRDISRSHMRWRYGLTPTMYSLMDEAVEEGRPPLRPMIYEFQEDERLIEVQDQAMLGRWLLAAPILEEGATGRRVVLPEGRWFEYHSGALYEGPATLDINATLAALPLYVRDGGIVLRMDPPSTLDGPLAGPLYIDAYPKQGETTTQRLYEDDGNGPPSWTDRPNPHRRLELRLTGDAQGATLEAAPLHDGWSPAPRRLIVQLRRVDSAPTAVTLDGAAIQPAEDVSAMGAATWRYDARARALLIGLDDASAFTLRADYDPTISELIYDVEIDLVVRPPEGTPMDTPMTVATSENGWTHQPLVWDEAAGVARGTITAPAGAWFEYKFARGGWCTVEKWPECEEATNRYAFGFSATREDQVWGWRDWCDDGPCEE